VKPPSVVLDTSNYSLIVRQKAIHFRQREMDILKVLDNRRGHIVSHEEFAQIWSDYPTDSRASVRVHVRHIRAKLGRDAGVIQTIKNCGYVLAA
jgi:DNA-binding response OmpR family regulator